MTTISRPDFELLHRVPDDAVYRLLGDAFAPAIAVIVSLGPNQPYLVKSDGSVEAIHDFFPELTTTSAQLLSEIADAATEAGVKIKQS